MAFAEPIDVYFADFAVDAVRAAGASSKVIFDAPYQGALSMIESSNPTATAKDGDIVRDEVLTIKGTRYKAVRPEPDGTGFTVWQLERQP